PVDAGGRALNAERIQWRSSNPAIASINASTGEVRGISEGDVEIQAAGARATATAKLAVRGSVAGRVDTRTMPPPETAKAPPPNPQPAVDPARARADDSDAGGVVAAQQSIASYFAAVASRDTGRVHRAFPGASAQTLSQWQGMYDGTEQVRAEVLDTSPLDPVPPSGGTMRFRVRWRISYRTRGDRRDRVETQEHTATVRRDAGSWILTGLDKR
ncbi:MAG: Ig-like domain-containing protein, partial [Gemmatimonadaceae bacterium]